MDDNLMIVVTRANGELGRAVMEGLLTRTPADRIVACVSDPAKATALAARGVDVRAGDFAKPDELATAFQGAEQMLIVSVDQLGETGRRLRHTAIEAARAAGARRVLYTSHMGTHAESSFNDHHSAAPPLTAAEAFTMADLAAIASELTGREIRRVTVPDDEWRDATMARGVPAPVAGLLLGMYRDARRGVFAAVDPTPWVACSAGSRCPCEIS